MAISPLSIRILGTGHALPKTRLLSEDIDRDLGFELGQIESMSGVGARWVCKDETQIDLAVEAATRAISDAGIDKDEIDLVLGASGLPYQALPTTAPLIMRGLGLIEGSAEAHDINSTCLSFVTALDIAAARIALGHANTVLIVSSEVASRALPWANQPDVAALFGDGAAAAVVTASEPQSAAICGRLMRTYPSGYEASSIVAGGTRINYHSDPKAFAENAFFRMDGAALFKLTHRHFPAFVQDLLQMSGWSEKDVDLIVPHQASPLALEHMVKATGLASDKVVNIAADFGNQVAASIPTALDIARRDGRISDGMRVLLLGTSAGVSFGGMAIVV